MKKRLLHTLCCLLCAVCAGWVTEAQAADDDLTRLVMELRDGTTDVYELADKPIVTFDGSKVKIASAAATADYERSDVKNFHFTSAATGLSDVAAQGALTLRYTDNESVTLTGNGLIEASLYNAEGKLMNQVSAQNGTLTLSLKSYVPGIYLLNVPGHTTYKLIKK